MLKSGPLLGTSIVLRVVNLYHVVSYLQVGMTKSPWSPGEVQRWIKLAKEAHKFNDIIIGPYLDDRSVELDTAML